jgi:hypothetical protein
MCWVVVALGTLSFSAHAQIHERWWSGRGQFKVKTADWVSEVDCSFLTLHVALRDSQLRLSAQYNCEDLEDQEILMLPLEIRGTDLFSGIERVGFFNDQQLRVRFQEGVRWETFDFDLNSENQMNFRFQSSQGGSAENELSGASLTFFGIKPF